MAKDKLGHGSEKRNFGSPFDDFFKRKLLKFYPKVYRSGSIDSNNPAGIFLSSKKETASLYEILKHERVKEYTIDPNAKIKMAETREQLLQEIDPRFNPISLNERLYAEERKAIKDKRAGLRSSSLIDGMTPRQRYETIIEKRIAEKLGNDYDAVLYESGGKNDQIGEYQVFNKKIIIESRNK